MQSIVRFLKSFSQEMYRFYFCKRVWSFFCILLFYLYIYMKPIRKFSILKQYPATPWGIIFLFSALYFNLIFVLGAIYLYSRVPFMERGQMYQFIRLGRKKWISIQILKILSTSFFYVGTVILFSILIMMPHLEIKNEWGKLFYTLALTNAQQKIECMFEISYDLIKNYDPIPLMAISFIVISLIVFLIGLIMFLLSLCFTRVVAIIVATFFAVAPIILENVNRRAQQIMVEIIPTEWIKISKVGKTNFIGVLSPDFDNIIVRLLVIISILVILIYLLGNRISYNWNGED